MSGRTSLPVPPGFTAYDLNGNRLTHIPLSQTGQAVVEIKTGGGTLTAGQTNVYPQVQAGTATGVGVNADRALMNGSAPATPVTILQKDRP